MTVSVPLPPVDTPDKYGGTPELFDAQVQAWLDWLATAAPLMNAQNADNERLNVLCMSLSAQAQTAAAQSSTAATASQASASLKGSWSALTGALAMPASVQHKGRIWALLSNLANVAAVEPGTAPAIWYEVGSSVRVETGASRRPSFAVDVGNSWVVDPRITFTRAGSAERIGRRMLPETMGTNAPRVQFDPLSGACMGLRVEDLPSTNRLLRSHEFENAAWGKSALSASTTAAGPRGAGTARLLTEDAANSQHSMSYPSIGVTDGVVYTFSLSLKHNGANRALRITPGGAVQFGTNVSALTVRPDTGDIVGVGSSVIRYSVRPDAAGFIRCSVTSRAISTQTNIGALVQMTSALNSTLLSYQGDGVSSILIADAQHEAAAYPSARKVCTGSAVTQVADVAQVAPAYLADCWDSAQAGNSLLVSFVSGMGFTSDGVNRLLTLDDGTSSNSLQLQQVDGTLQMVLTQGGAQVALLDLGTVAVYGQTCSVALSYLHPWFSVARGEATNGVMQAVTPFAVSRILVGSVLRLVGWRAVAYPLTTLVAESTV